MPSVHIKRSTMSPFEYLVAAILTLLVVLTLCEAARRVRRYLIMRANVRRRLGI